MKRLFKYFIVLILFVSTLTSCGGGTDIPGETTDEKYAYVFNQAVEEGKDCNGIMDSLTSAKICKYKLSKTETKKGYVNGYKNKTITSYEELVTVAPNTISVTYVMHVFYSENPEELLTQLQTNYDDGAWGCYSTNNDRAQYYTSNGKYVLAVVYPI